MPGSALKHQVNGWETHRGSGVAKLSSAAAKSSMPRFWVGPKPNWSWLASTGLSFGSVLVVSFTAVTVSLMDADAFATVKQRCGCMALLHGRWMCSMRCPGPWLRCVSTSSENTSWPLAEWRSVRVCVLSAVAVYSRCRNA